MANIMPIPCQYQKLSKEESTTILRDWLDKCDLLSGRKLDFNPNQKIKDNLKHVGSYFPSGFKKIKTDPIF